MWTFRWRWRSKCMYISTIKITSQPSQQPNKLTNNNNITKLGKHKSGYWNLKVTDESVKSSHSIVSFSDVRRLSSCRRRISSGSRRGTFPGTAPPATPSSAPPSRYKWQSSILACLFKSWLQLTYKLRTGKSDIKLQSVPQYNDFIYADIRRFTYGEKKQPTYVIC